VNAQIKWKVDSIPSLTIPKKIGPHPSKFFIQNLSFFPDNQIRIFDKSGNLVFKAKPYLQNWPLKEPSESKYFYILDLDDKRISGWLLIERVPEVGLQTQ
jgi:hypothetical protein